ncbi:MAG: type II secretion system F family protein [Nitrospirae bacterium YQR-1]
MPSYAYKAVDENGDILKGIIEAEDVSTFNNTMQLSRLHVISVKEKTGGGVLPSVNIFGKKIQRKDIIELATNLAVMIDAGLPLLTAFDDLITTTELPFFKQKLITIRRQVMLGSSLSDAITQERDIFPDIFIRLVRIGEETGSLGKSLKDVAEHLQRMEDLASAIKRALMYPTFALITTSGALFFWLVVVMPKMAVLFEDMGVALPLITQVLIKTSKSAESNWYIILAVPVALSALFKYLGRYEKFQYFLDYTALKMPIIKLISYNKVLALFSEQMRILLVAGITINRSFELLQETIGNMVFSRAFVRVNDLILSGVSVGDSLRLQRIFPVLVVRMVSVGEASGSLDAQFGFLSEYFLKKLDDISQKMSKLIEPVVMVFVGIMFTIMIVGVFAPIYDLISGVGAQQ